MSTTYTITAPPSAGPGGKLNAKNLASNAAPTKANTGTNTSTNNLNKLKPPGTINTANSLNGPNSNNTLKPFGRAPKPIPHVGDAIASWENLKHGFTTKGLGHGGLLSKGGSNVCKHTTSSGGDGTIDGANSTKGVAQGYVVFRWNQSCDRIVVERESWKEGFDCSTQSAHIECMKVCQEILDHPTKGLNPFWAGYSLNAVDDSRPGHRKEERKLVAFMITPRISARRNFEGMKEEDERPSNYIFAGSGGDNDNINNQNGVSTASSSPKNANFSPPSRSLVPGANNDSNLSPNSHVCPHSTNDMSFDQLPESVQFVRNQTNLHKNRIRKLIFGDDCALYLETHGISKMADNSYLELVHDCAGKPKSHLHFGGDHKEKSRATMPASPGAKNNTNNNSLLQEDISDAHEKMTRKLMRKTATTAMEEEKQRRIKEHDAADRSEWITRRMHARWSLIQMNEEWGRRVLKEKNTHKDPARIKHNEMIKEMLIGEKSNEASEKYEKMNRYWGKLHAEMLRDKEAKDIALRMRHSDAMDSKSKKERESLIHKIYNAEQARRSSADCLEEEYRRSSLAKAVSHGVHYELDEVANVVERAMRRNNCQDELDEEQSRRVYKADLPSPDHVRSIHMVGRELKNKIRMST